VAETEPGGGKTIIAHEGGINGFNTLEERVVDDHALIVLLNNTPGANLGEIAAGIRAILYGREPAAPKRPLVTTLGDTIIRRGSEAAVIQYRDLWQNHRAEYDFAEPRLNELGYTLLRRDRTVDAIAIFKLNVEEYPKSGNVYDSLAEAYEKSGQKDLAVANYRKSLEIDPKNQHGQERLKALEAR
jgi:tetratricopeptide (TPR) repeat protein